MSCMYVEAQGQRERQHVARLTGMWVGGGWLLGIGCETGCFRKLPRNATLSWTLWG